MASGEDPTVAFEAGQKLLRDAFAKVTIARETELAKMRNEITSRDMKIADLQKKVQRLMEDMQKVSSENQQLHQEVDKLHALKKNILEQFDDRDLTDRRVYGSSEKPLYQQQQQQQHQTSPPVASAAAGSKQKHHHLHQQYKADDFGSGGGVASASDFFAPPPSGLKSNGAFNPSSELTMDELSEDDSAFDLPVSTSGLKGGKQQQQPQPQLKSQQQPKTSFPNATTSTAYSAPNATVVDGKEFFNNARARLSYDSFSLLLGHIQKYNRRERSKDETLEALSRLFDNTQRDLFDQFVAMVNQ